MQCCRLARRGERGGNDGRAILGVEYEAKKSGMGSGTDDGQGGGEVHVHPVKVGRGTYIDRFHVMSPADWGPRTRGTLSLSPYGARARGRGSAWPALSPRPFCLLEAAVR